MSQLNLCLLSDVSMYTGMKKDGISILALRRIVRRWREFIENRDMLLRAAAACRLETVIKCQPRRNERGNKKGS
jgi:hypothetical protein